MEEAKYPEEVIQQAIETFLSSKNFGDEQRSNYGNCIGLVLRNSMNVDTAFLVNCFDDVITKDELRGFVADVKKIISKIWKAQPPKKTPVKQEVPSNLSHHKENGQQKSGSGHRSESRSVMNSSLKMDSKQQSYEPKKKSNDDSSKEGKEQPMKRASTGGQELMRKRSSETPKQPLGKRSSEAPKEKRQKVDSEARLKPSISRNSQGSSGGALQRGNQTLSFSTQPTPTALLSGQKLENSLNVMKEAIGEVVARYNGEAKRVDLMKAVTAVLVDRKKASEVWKTLQVPQPTLNMYVRKVRARVSEKLEASADGSAKEKGSQMKDTPRISDRSPSATRLPKHVLVGDVAKTGGSAKSNDLKMVFRISKQVVKLGGNAETPKATRISTLPTQSAEPEKPKVEMTKAEIQALLQKLMRGRSNDEEAMGEMMLEEFLIRERRKKFCKENGMPTEEYSEIAGYVMAKMGGVVLKETT